MIKYIAQAILLSTILSCSSPNPGDRIDSGANSNEKEEAAVTDPSGQGSDTGQDTSEVIERIRIEYRSEAFNFGELILPEEGGKRPVIMIIHGGCWRSSYDYTLMDDMAADLANRGYITWNIEYRRTEDNGGRWPATITDAAYALKALENMAETYPIDLDRIVVTGHSAGGHLALMLGAQYKMPATHPLKVPDLPEIKGIVSLAGITDLVTYLAPTGCGSNVQNLVEGLPDEVPDRYRDGSPINYLPLGIPQRLVTGVDDAIVSIDHIQPYLDKAKDLGDNIALSAVPDAGHFEVIQPGSIAWDPIVTAFAELIEE